MQKNNNVYQQINKLLKDLQEIRNRISQEPDNLNHKKAYYKKKIEIIDLIKQEKELKSITAKELLKRGIPLIERYATNIPTLDRALNGGIPLGNFIQLAGASGAGKTTLSLKIMSEIAKKERIVHFDFEMGEYKIAKELSRFLKTEKQLENYIIDFSSYNLNDLISEIEIYSKEGIKFFLIDSKMKIETDAGYSYYESSRIISKELQKMVRENNITIILINQLSEAAIKDGMATLKGGNDQKYDSDIIIMLYKYYYMDEENLERKKMGIPLKPDNTKRQLFIAKNRLGEDEVGYDLPISELEIESSVMEITPNIDEELNIKNEISEDNNNATDILNTIEQIKKNEEINQEDIDFLLSLTEEEKNNNIMPF